MHTSRLALGAWLVLVIALAADEAPKPAGPGTIVVLDAAGKEQKVKSWTFTTGTRRLSWLAPAEKAGDGKNREKKAASGPEALVVRDELKFTFLAGVVTLIPVDRLRSIQFDGEKMTVRAAGGPKEDDDIALIGTTAYKGINKVTLEAEVDKGEAGVATLTFQGGVPRGIKGIRFPEPKADAFKPGRPAVVHTQDKDARKTHKVSDLQPLYVIGNARVGGREKLSTTLMFKKTLKLDVSKIKSITAGADDSDDTVWQVVQKDGDDSTLTLLPSITLDGEKATLVGLVGRLPIGYKLFPIKRINKIEFDTIDEGKEKKGKDVF